MFIPVKAELVFALRWNSAGLLCTSKKLLRFVEECREKWGDIAWEQIASEEYGAIDAKKGEAETKNVDETHERDLK